VTFYVVNVVDNKEQVRRGVEVVSTVAKRLRESSDTFDFRVVELDTVGEFYVQYFIFKNIFLNILSLICVDR